MIKIEGSGSASGSGSIMDPRIRIHTKMSWICNTADESDDEAMRGSREKRTTTG
jgi:hypothetical protein